MKTLQSTSTQKRVSFVTLGCAKNEVDSATMKELVASAGYLLVDNPEDADVVVLNTCSFIQAATEESIDTIFELAQIPRIEEGGAKLVVAGCMVSRYGDDLKSELSEVAAFLPCKEEDQIVGTIAGLIGASEKEHTAASIICGSVSTYVKISDGCDRFCAYCTIPYIRGRYHSFTYEPIHKDILKAQTLGAKEIVLIAQDTGRWGADFEEPLSLAWLLDSVAKAFPELWFRVMYLQPEGLTDDVLDAVASNNNICKYFDIPLQHVNADILTAMNRRGAIIDYASFVQRIKERIPEVTLRTTLIAGFPGETEEQFEEMCDFVEEGYFDYVGVFAYSREDGTAAAELPDQVEDEIKQERAQIVRDLADGVSLPIVASRIGKTIPVLVEGTEEDGQLFGRAMCQAPEVDGVVYLDKGEPGQIVNALIVDTLLYEMEGEVQ